MRTIELLELPNARDLQARYGVSGTWLERHIQGHGFPQPIKLGVRVGAVRHWHRATVLTWEIHWGRTLSKSLCGPQGPTRARTMMCADNPRNSAEEVKRHD